MIGLTLLVALAGGIGSIARLVLDGAIKRWVPADFPTGIVVINIVGSFLLGSVTGLAVSGVVDPSVQAVIGTGFVGGFTTFSTASVDSVRLLLAGRRRAALANVVGVVGASLLAAAGGIAAGSALGGVL